MKILAFVDLHGSTVALKRIVSTAKAEKVDYIVCAGDITIFGDSMQQIIDKLDAIGCPVLMINGNHESENAMKQLCQKARNVRFIHKEIVESGNCVFLGYGGGGFSTTDDDFEAWSKEAMMRIGQGKKVILVTHAPPYNTKLDLILDQPAGNKSVREFIKTTQPVLAISGHLHENAGMKDKIGRTKLVNPGPWGMLLNV